jgi:hypothetical protein
MSPHMKNLILLTSVTVILLGSGCAHVQPWERGSLADSIMLPDRDSLGEQMAEHMWFSREAAAGGKGVGGGGCGCN